MKWTLPATCASGVYVVPTSALAFARNTAETPMASSYRWFSARTKLSRGFCEQALIVIEEEVSRTLGTHGQTQALKLVAEEWEVQVE